MSTTEIDQQIAELRQKRRELLAASRLPVMVSVRMTSDEAAALDERAKFFRVTRSELVRRILATEIRLPMVEVVS